MGSGLLAPPQQQLPEDLTAALTEALASSDRGETEPTRDALRLASQVAVRLGYL